jgi:hypothetical protein
MMVPGYAKGATGKSITRMTLTTRGYVGSAGDWRGKMLYILNKNRTIHVVSGLPMIDEDGDCIYCETHCGLELNKKTPGYSSAPGELKGRPCKDCLRILKAQLAELEAAGRR